MREIKFRCFDLQNKKFVEGDILRDYVLGEMLDDVSCEVSQFTGLKDKNDKEIYVGDIVRYTSNERIGTRGNYKNSYSVYGDVEITGVVRFGNIEHHHDYKHILTFFVDSNDTVSYDSYFYSDSKNRGPQKHTSKLTKPLLLKKEYEVIGNIYEGLMEESK